MNIVEKLKELGSHFFIYGLGSIAQSAAGFILLPLIASNLEPADYGIYTLINLIGLLAGTVFYFGISSALPRSFYEHESEEKQKEVLGTALLLTLIGVAIQSVLGVAFSRLLSSWLFQTDKYSVLIGLMVFAAAVGFTNTFLQTYFRLLHKSKFVVGLGLVAAALNIMSVYIFIKVFGLKIEAPIYGYLISQFVILLIAFVASRKSLVFKIDRLEARFLLSFGIPTVFASFAVMGIEWADRLFLEHYLTITDVGIYSLAYKLGSVINALFVIPFTQIWNPIMMKSRTQAGVDELFKKVLTYYFLVGILLVFFAVAFLDEIAFVVIKNESYYPGLKIVPIIMAGILIYGTSNIFCAGFFYSRKVSLITYIYIVIAVVNLGLNFLLIPSYGYLGAAWASFGTYLLIPMIMRVTSRKLFHFNIEYDSLFKLTVSFVIGWFLLQEASQFEDSFIRILYKVVISILGLVSITLFTLNSSERTHIFSFLRLRRSER